MIEGIFSDFIDWITQYPHWIEFIVFLIAMAESLAFVGLIIPGVAMMFAVGALVGSGMVPFASVCQWAIVGAFAGDSLSFWFGRRFHSKLKELWPFKAYPWMIERGVGFFHRFGGRSVLFGRFFGPVRGIIPMVAGMLDMPAGRFVAIAVISAVLWAPVYLIPGMVFGASLELASKVAGRLVLLIVLLVVIIWLAIWLSKKIYWFLLPRAYRFVHFIFDWNKHHPVVAKLTNPVLDASQRDYFSLFVFGSAIFLVASWFGHYISDQPAIGVLRTPWMDSLFQSLSRFGSYPATTTMFLIVATLFALTKQYVALVHWLIGFVFCIVAVETSQFFYTEPSLDGYVVRMIFIFGFLAALLAGSIARAQAGLIYSSVCIICLLVVFARIYLGALSPINGLNSAISSLAWTSVVGIGYRRHTKTPPEFKLMIWAPVLFLVGFSTVMYVDPGNRESAVKNPEKLMTMDEWQQGGWKLVLGVEPEFSSQSARLPNLQWPLSLAEITSQFKSKGWMSAPALNLKNMLRWLSPDPDLENTPLLPEFIQERAEVLTLVKLQSSSTALILRIWPSQWVTSETSHPIWIGRMGLLSQDKRSTFLRYPEEVPLQEQQIIATISALNVDVLTRNYTFPNVRQNFPMILVGEKH